VRTLFVVDGPELVEAFLLTLHGRLRRPRGFGLEGAVHPFVCAVLLRMAGHDALDPDARPDAIPAGVICRPLRGLETGARVPPAGSRGPFSFGVLRTR